MAAGAALADIGRVTDSTLQGASVLVVEDEPLLRKQVAAALEQHDADVTAVGTLDEARRMIQSLPFDFALLDVNLPDGLGTDLLSENVFSPNTAVVVCTAEGGVQGAVEAIKNGAQDYLLKPVDPAVLPLVLHRAKAGRQTARLAEHERHDPAATGDRLFFGDALGPFRQQLDKIIAADERLGRDLPPVLLEGETGTGKTSIARWLHHHGPLAAGPLVEVNCPALPESLAESELFGHERGAFTDAKTARMGLFEAAKGGMAGLLLFFGAVILARFGFGMRIIPTPKSGHTARWLSPIGLLGGFVDATGGGGWGPVVTPSLMTVTSHEPRKVVGTTNAAEFAVAVSVSIGFITGAAHQDIPWLPVLGLVLGGVIVAPIAARLAGRLPHAPMGVMVGGLIILVNSIAVLGSFADLPLPVDLALIVGWIVLVAQVAWKAWLRERAGRTQDEVPTEPTPA